MQKHSTFLRLSLLLTIFSFCTTINAQQENSSKEISKTFYLSGNTSENPKESKELFKAVNELSKQDKNATLLLMGNILKPGGFPHKDEEQNRKETKSYLKNNLLDPVKDFNGEIIFNPGPNEWNKLGHENIDDLESFLQDNSNAEFWPNDGCSLKNESYDEIELLMVDSQWFFEDWDEHPYINNKCEEKTRKQFFLQFKDDIKDVQGKLVIVAVHHPIMTSTKLGFFENLGGFTSDSYYGAKRKQLRGRMETIARSFEDVIFVSASDHNLQLMVDDALPQIISGSSTKKTNKFKKQDETRFAKATQGFAKLIVYKDQTSTVEFYEVNNGKAALIGTEDIKRDRIDKDEVKYHTKDEFGETYKASIYTEEETDKSGLHKWFWGDHYRQIYSRKIEAPVFWADELPGNPKATREGGGNQSRSLRIVDDEEHAYTLRELRKSALRFIQSSINTHYVQDYMENTVAESVVQDFYTTAHPYAQFAVQELLDDVDIYHTKTDIYYVPKQKNLHIYNEDYGDKLYMVEKHIGDENKEFEIFGSPDDILSTSDMKLEVRESKKEVKIDEEVFIRARLMDMLIGDWDRHSDQWRWAEFEQEDGTKLYKAIPRDRDQAFPKYDGIAIKLLKVASPLFRNMEDYGPDVKNVKWLNKDGYELDKIFIQEADLSVWRNQAEFIQQQLTDENIDEAFATLLDDVQDESIEQIKKDLKARRDNLVDIAERYYKYFKKFETVIGTENEDEFIIERKKNGITTIQIKDEDGTLVFDNTYNKDETKEIWIYGLDDDDKFTITGEGDNYIKLKILGGENNDVYDFQNTKKAKVYEYKSKNNTFEQDNIKKWLTDSYSINKYDPAKKKYNYNLLLPSIAFDPDAGLQLGVKDIFTTYGLSRNPFTTQHTVEAKYHSATNGVSFSYNGEFANVFYNWNFGVEAMFKTPTYAINYFGSGNETTYDEDAVDKDYNRVGLKQIRLAPSLIWRHEQGYNFYVKPMVESFEAEFTEGETTDQFFSEDDDLFTNQYYAGGEVGFNYSNKSNKLAYIRRGMMFGLTTGYKTNIDDNNNEFIYLEPTISLDYPLHESGIVVLATKVSGKTIIGDNYEFYHGAMLGGNNSLRGFRNERFNGKSSFYQSTDLRVGITQFRTNYVPIRLGVTAGFDYGRVWTENDNSNKWHNNYGGSIWVNGFQALTGNLGLYHSDEGYRLMFSVGFLF
ncbi:ShlB/FhaC/HecB family hemolysin secretion/activation protein [Mesonia aquimarina]|uniref:ShlB/FhaC/HecB family hemolysin secretion/activation protein n=1 Tax=Mesonia aquimarina TaxID=1504967 RepID=UPI000EF634BD|nr:metallophosphatase [Mesonia aquimarina]